MRGKGKENRPNEFSLKRKKNKKTKVLGFFEYDDVLDLFPSSSNSSGPDSDFENYSLNAPKVKKKKDAPDPRVTDDKPVKKVKQMSKQMVSKGQPSKVRKVPGKKGETCEVKVTRKRKLAVAAVKSPEKSSVCQLQTRKMRSRNAEETTNVEKSKRKKTLGQDENLLIDEDLTMNFSPTKLAKQTSTPARGTSTRNKRPRQPLTDILSPVPRGNTPSLAVNFDNTLSHSDRFGRSYSRPNLSGLKPKKKQKKKKVQYGSSDDESGEEDNYVAARPTKKSKKTLLKEQKEKYVDIWAAEVNADFSDIEKHVLCVEYD